MSSVRIESHDVSRVVVEPPEQHPNGGWQRVVKIQTTEREIPGSGTETGDIDRHTIVLRATNRAKLEFELR